MKLTELLRACGCEKDGDFQARLCPILPRERFLGVKVPRLREIEKQYRGSAEAAEFLSELPHRYYDENLLHSIFLSGMKNYDAVLPLLDVFLPYVDNWAVCDTLHPAAFRKHPADLPERIRGWIGASEPFICRFGVDVLMTYYLDEAFRPEYLELPAAVRSEEYYVNMMLAWFYATALTKQWDAALPYLTERRLTPWVHNKTIQKARESFRITPEQKQYLITLKI